LQLKQTLELQVGGVIQTSNQLLVFAVIAAFVFGAGLAYGQALELSFDLNTPVSHSPPFSEGDMFDVTSAPAFGVGIYSKHAFAGGDPFRIGVHVGRQALSVEGMEDNLSNGEHNAFNFQLCTDLLLLGNQRFRLSSGLAPGITFFSHSNNSYLNLPKIAVFLTPSLRTTIRLLSRMSFVFEAKWPVYFSPNDLFPFRSGGVLVVGLEVGAIRRNNKDGEF